MEETSDSEELQNTANQKEINKDDSFDEDETNENDMHDTNHIDYQEDNIDRIDEITEKIIREMEMEQRD